MAKTIDDLRNAVAAYEEQHPRASRGKGIQLCDEVKRVRDLPRRDAFADAEQLVAELTAMLRQPCGTQTLREAQAVALYEIAAYGGIMSPIRVGGGKTLVALLAGIMCGARKVLVLMPAKLIKSKRKEIISYRKNWLVPDNVTIMSYERLGREKQKNYLFDMGFDLIVADEAHRLRDLRRSRTRRVKRYVETTRCAFLPLSGTLWGKRLVHWAHLAKWALKERSPAPLKEGTVMSWGSALDAEPSREPGALSVFVQADQLGWDIREVYRERVLSAPGIVATRDAMLGTALYISPWHCKLSPVLQEALDHLCSDDADWVLPDGLIVTDPLHLHRALRQLELGCFLHWIEQPTQEWRDKRLEWSRFVRQAVRYSHDLDSELMVINACDRGELDATALNEWRAIKETFKPKTECVWLDDSPVRAIAEVARITPMVIWVHHREVGYKLDELGIPYYGAGGLDKAKRFIEDTDGSTSIAASISSSGEGRNIHEAFANGFIAEFPRDPDALEQLIGRHHRDGQPEDECYIWVAQNTDNAINAWEATLERARHQELSGGQPQKVLLATYIEEGDDDEQG